MKPNDQNRGSNTTPQEQEHVKKPSAIPPSRKPPRAAPWWIVSLFVVVALIGIAVGVTFSAPIAQGLRALVGPGEDPDSTTMQTAGDGEPAADYYTCGMHPWVILPKPGDCPICHMDLTPLDPAKFTGEVVIDPVVVQNIGVRVEPVAEGPLVRTIRTVGTVDFDETRVRDVNTKISGWIERLYVDYVGAPVQQGEPLFEVYSPALFQAQEEYLLALKTRRNAPPSESRAGQPLDLVASARTKLALFDIAPEQIEALAEAGEPSRTMTVLSPHTGVVIAKHANEGMKVDPGMQVFRIADLSKVWVIATLYESQLPFVSEGQRAVMTLSYIPGQTFEGRVTYIYPYIDPRTREAQVRLEFDNPTGLLKPGMFATVELKSTLKQESVLAPRAAVISTGERDVSFVSLGEGRFEPRQVRLGVETGDGMVEILDGLKPGEMVVTSGQFLLDSESRVREALAKMIRGDLAADQKAQVATADAAALQSLPDELASSLTAALQAYFVIGDRLAGDSAKGLAEPARNVAAALDRAIGVPIPEAEHFWREHTEAAVARGAALQLVDAKDLPAARETFAQLSLALDELVRATGVPPAMEQEVQSLHCPMFREGQGGATWLQPAGRVRNPFFGAMMLECFDQREALPVTGASPDPEAEPPAPREPAPQPAAGASPEAEQALEKVVAAYLAAQEALARDDAKGAAAALADVKPALQPLLGLPGEAGQAADRIASALPPQRDDLAGLREAFSTTSDALLVIAGSLQPASTEPGLFHAYCPMVKEHWLQAGEKISNPYDPRMPACGVIKGRLDAGSQP